MVQNKKAHIDFTAEINKIRWYDFVLSLLIKMSGHPVI